MRVLGAILAGGQARRFGSDKALALLDGRTLLDHAADQLAPHVADIVLCGRTAGGWTCLPDRPRRDLGPLGGLAAALHHAAHHGFAAVLAVPCDTPLLPDGLLASLLAARAPCFAAALPVCGYWPAELAEALDRHLATGDDRSMHGWAHRLGAGAVGWDAPILNINHQADLVEARRGS